MKGERPDWYPDWAGQYVAVIGGGASVKRSDIDSLRGRLRVVVINESYQLAPWADALYSCDYKWWKLRWNLVKDFKGLKVTQDALIVREHPEIKRLRLRDGTPGQPIKYFLMDEWGVIGSGQGSGFQVVNWLAQIGVAGIALLGFDGCIINNKVHWHGSHPIELTNPDNSTFVAWKTWLENAAPKLHELGIEVINTSMFSTVGRFPRIEVAATMARWGL